MKSNTSTKIIYWVCTSLVAVMGILSIATFKTPEALEGSAKLGLPLWFHYELSIAKGIGGLVLILPFFPKRIKEWAYVGFGIDFVSAFIAIAAVQGTSPTLVAPVIAMAILAGSYISYHKLHPGNG